MTSPPAPAAPAWTTRRIILATLVIGGVVLGFWGLYQLRLVVAMLFTAIIIGTALKPLTGWLSGRGVPLLVSIVLIYVGLLIGLGTVVLLTAPLLFEQVRAIIETLPDYYHDFRTMLRQSPNLLLQQLSWRLPQQLAGSGLAAATGAEEWEAITRSLEAAGMVSRTILITVATLLLSVYWTIEGERAIRSVLFFLPSDRREGARDLIEAMQTKVSAYLQGQAILCVVVGLLALVAYLLIGVPYAIALALFAGLMEAVPYLGPTLGALPAVLMAASVAPEKAIWVVAATLIIQQLENTFLVPRVMNKAVGVNPFVALLAIVTFGSLLGIVGVFLAIPIAAMLQLVLDRVLLDPAALLRETGTGRGDLSRLRYQIRELMQDMQKQARQAETRTIPENEPPLMEDMEAIAVDLDSILAQTEAVEDKA